MVEQFARFIVAMRERTSIVEVVTAYERGLMTSYEVLYAAATACWGQPALAAEIARQFRACSNEHLAELVGDGLLDIMR